MSASAKLREPHEAGVEVPRGALGKAKATHPEVKAFAEQMVRGLKEEVGKQIRVPFRHAAPGARSLRRP